jgi:hypothetical protein
MLERYWSVGQLCVARYPTFTEGWYRGLIVYQWREHEPSVNEASSEKSNEKKNFVKVLFVDYGETKTLCPADGTLRKIMPRTLLSIPVLVLTFSHIYISYY